MDDLGQADALETEFTRSVSASGLDHGFWSKGDLFELLDSCRGIWHPIKCLLKETRAAFPLIVSALESLNQWGKGRWRLLTFRAGRACLAKE